MSSSKNWPVKGFSGRCVLAGDTVSDVGMFDPALWNVALLTFVQFSPPPPQLPPLPGRVWGYRRGRGLRLINICRKVRLQVNLFRWQHFALVSIKLISPYSHLSSPLIILAHFQKMQKSECVGRQGLWTQFFIKFCLSFFTSEGTLP